jgi:outer membrane lipoprotein-sorting protein
MHLKIFFLLIGLSSQANSLTPKTVSKKNTLSQKLDNIYNNIEQFKAMSLNFNQKTFRKLRKRISQSSGSAYFIKPNKFIWKYHTPVKDTWIFDGSRFLSWTQGEKFALEYPQGSNKGKELRQVMNMVLNFKEVKKDYQVEIIPHKQKNKNPLNPPQKTTLLLTPKNSQTKFFTSIETLTVTLEKNKKSSTHKIKSIKLNFLRGNYSEFTFASIAKSLVDLKRLKLPPNIKVQKAL